MGQVKHTLNTLHEQFPLAIQYSNDAVVSVVIDILCDKRINAVKRLRAKRVYVEAIGEKRYLSLQEAKLLYNYFVDLIVEEELYAQDSVMNVLLISERKL